MPLLARSILRHPLAALAMLAPLSPPPFCADVVRYVPPLPPPPPPPLPMHRPGPRPFHPRLLLLNTDAEHATLFNKKFVAHQSIPRRHFFKLWRARQGRLPQCPRLGCAASQTLGAYALRRRRERLEITNLSPLGSDTSGLAFCTQLDSHLPSLLAHAAPKPPIRGREISKDTDDPLPSVKENMLEQDSLFAA